MVLLLSAATDRELECWTWNCRNFSFFFYSVSILHISQSPSKMAARCASLWKYLPQQSTVWSTGLWRATPYPHSQSTTCQNASQLVSRKTADAHPSTFKKIKMGKNHSRPVNWTTKRSKNTKPHGLVQKPSSNYYEIAASKREVRNLFDIYCNLGSCRSRDAVHHAAPCPPSGVDVSIDEMLHNDPPGMNELPLVKIPYSRKLTMHFINAINKINLLFSRY